MFLFFLFLGVMLIGSLCYRHIEPAGFISHIVNTQFITCILLSLFYFEEFLNLLEFGISKCYCMAVL